MKTIWLLLVTASLATAASAGETVIIEGHDAYPPYAYVENDQYKGIYVELITLAAKQLAPHYNVVLKPTPWKRGLKNLQEGKSLALFAPFHNKERSYIGAYSTPLYRETVVLFCTDTVMNKSPRRFPEDFAGLTIGANLGFFLGEEMAAATKAKVFTISESQGNQTNLQHLQTGAIDCYASDRLAAYYSFNLLLDLQRHRNLTRFEGFRLNPAHELSSEETFIAYSATYPASYKDDFIKQMNAALGQLEERGVINQLIGRAIESNLSLGSD
ncbi:MAG: transporter substrate-binding domain-containing protein [Pseudomonadaceae bacterium]|nr:transporter substrate-binding domain-containing protein [Pseudomonadaceae bacterium]